MAGENGLTRLDRIERAIESLTADLQVQRVNIESLHSSLHELHGIVQKQGGSIEAQGRLIEAQGRSIDKLITVSEQLARIAEIHERRLTNLEGGETQ